jgi:hypothetical protein
MKKYKKTLPNRKVHLILLNQIIFIDINKLQTYGMVWPLGKELSFSFSINLFTSDNSTKISL